VVIDKFRPKVPPRVLALALTQVPAPSLLDLEERGRSMSRMEYRAARIDLALYSTLPCEYEIISKKESPTPPPKKRKKIGNSAYYDEKGLE